MKKERIELTPEQREALLQENKRHFTLLFAIVFAAFLLVWPVLLVLDFVHGAAAMQIVLHGGCTLFNVFLAVTFFLRWRRMAAGSASKEEETHHIP